MSSEMRFPEIGEQQDGLFNRLRDAVFSGDGILEYRQVWREIGNDDESNRHNNQHSQAEFVTPPR